jgi:hypothetical protein
VALTTANLAIHDNACPKGGHDATSVRVRGWLGGVPSFTGADGRRHSEDEINGNVARRSGETEMLASLRRRHKRTESWMDGSRNVVHAAYGSMWNFLCSYDHKCSRIAMNANKLMG